MDGGSVAAQVVDGLAGAATAVLVGVGEPVEARVAGDGFELDAVRNQLARCAGRAAVVWAAATKPWSGWVPKTKRGRDPQAGGDLSAGDGGEQLADAVRQSRMSAVWAGVGRRRLYGGCGQGGTRRRGR